MVLTLNNIHKRYGDFTAVDMVNLTIETGELVSLLGPSGCGKTTTLQMVAGFTTPTQGQVILDGEDITQKPAHQRGIGIMFQSYALFPHMTVFENVAFGLEMRKIDKHTIKKQVFEKLDLVELTVHADKYPSALSGGQRQRVALARALVIEPPLLLLDEPLSALDAKIRGDMQNELRRIQQHLNITTVMVTHDQAEALAISDRVAIMNQGKIEQIDDPVSMYDAPQSLFVCTFLGKSNLLPAHLDSNGTCTPLYTAQKSADKNAHMIVRPEHIKITPVSQKTDTDMVGKITDRVFMGGHWLIDTHTPHGTLSIVSADSWIKDTVIGTEVALHIDTDKVAFLPA